MSVTAERLWVGCLGMIVERGKYMCLAFAGLVVAVGLQATTSSFTGTLLVSEGRFWWQVFELMWYTVVTPILK